LAYIVCALLSKAITERFEAVTWQGSFKLSPFEN
jgi:hypothetical protein